MAVAVAVTTMTILLARLDLVFASVVVVAMMERVVRVSNRARCAVRACCRIDSRHTSTDA